jgi:photosystem II stability/assembly factor-like uncharacterized protein
MVTPLVGWGSDQAAVLHTIDGGRRWRSVTPSLPGGRRYPIGYLALDVRSGSGAWLAAPNTFDPHIPTSVLLLHTTDAGSTWRRFSTLATGPYNGVVRLQFADARHGWLWVIRGASMMQSAFDIYRTGDGGRHWQHVLSESNANAAPVRPPIGGGLPTCDCMQGMSFLTPSAGWVAGCFCGIGTSPPLFFRTTDGGHTWRQAWFPLPSGAPVAGNGDVHAPVFFGPRNGVLPVFLSLTRPPRQVLDVYHTANGGRTWRGTSPVRVTQSDGADLVTFVDPNHGFLLDDTRLLRTNDGGRHWQAMPSRLDREHLGPLDFVTPSVAFALEEIGASGENRLLESRDGGRTWHIVQASLVGTA